MYYSLISVLLDITTSVPLNETWLDLFGANEADYVSVVENSTSYERVEKNPLAIINKPTFQITSTAQHNCAIIFLPLILLLS